MPDETDGPRISDQRAREIIAALQAQLGARMPLPGNLEPAAYVDRRLRENRPVTDRELHEFLPFQRRWFDSLSEQDIGRLDVLVALNPTTIKWIAEKNERELKNLDGAVEFISSSRTAAKVLMWVLGTSVTVVGGIIAMAKYGIDALAFLRGRP